jgi:DNA-directed RNA polymerase specialized sigma24 family protein
MAAEPASRDRSRPHVTELLLAWGRGDRFALDELVPIVHQELRRLARLQMRGERNNHTLQTTALVNEAFIRLVDLRHIRWQDRAHFLSLSARLMRRVLVDHARSRNYQKRGGGAVSRAAGRCCDSRGVGEARSRASTSTAPSETSFCASAAERSARRDVIFCT